MFSADEVIILAVAWEEGQERALDYISDTGLREPVALDVSGVDASCWDIPGGADSLYRFFDDRIPMSQFDSPFPFEILVAPDGTLAHSSRLHQPEVMLQKIGEMLD